MPETVSVNAGDCFVLDDGRLIEIAAAEEPVLVITGDLARLAWHIGNRHTPCQIEADRLLIRRDHVLEAMLRQLGRDGRRGAPNPSRPKAGPMAMAARWAMTTTHPHDHSHPHDHDHPHPYMPGSVA